MNKRGCLLAGSMSTTVITPALTAWRRSKNDKKSSIVLNVKRVICLFSSSNAVNTQLALHPRTTHNISAVSRVLFSASSFTSRASSEVVTFNFLPMMWYKPCIPQVRSSRASSFTRASHPETWRDERRENQCDITSTGFHGRHQNANANACHRTQCDDGLTRKPYCGHTASSVVDNRKLLAYKVTLSSTCKWR